MRLIAFYLPQFHPIPENDRAWGKGFTEWTNVARARPLFREHEQPRLPADLGFYDLRVPEVREAQAELARAHGIHGFCYYHYWFDGRRLLERPLDEVLASGKPEFPFCVCWANESWTRRWDGGNDEMIVEQRHGPDDDRAFIESLMPMFRDERYIRVNGRALLLVYRVDLFPDPPRTAGIWREAARKAGLEEPYLVTVESFANAADPRSIGFDAAVEFPGHQIPSTVQHKLPRDFEPKIRVFGYPQYADFMMDRSAPAYKRFRAILPSWDNTPRMGANANLFINASPEKYRQWLERSVALTRKEHAGDEQLVFVNAWNEWGEGCYLEPDQKHGHAYLEATRAALE